MQVNVKKTFSNKPLGVAALPRRRSALVVKAAQNPYPPRELDGAESALSSLPTVAVYALGAILVGGGAAVGSAAGAQFGTPARVAGAAVVGAAGAYATKTAYERRQKVAAVELQNVLSNLQDPLELSPDTVKSLEAKYGVSFNTQLNLEIRQIYDAFLSSQIPPGDQPLVGDEIDNIKRFKDALGISDEEAAQSHIDMGRRIARAKLEVSKRASTVEATRAFQKLIYVSSQVFGEKKAAFLLPWNRVFNMTDAALFVAKRDYARQLFRDRMAAMSEGLPADAAVLADLRAYADKIQLSLEFSVEIIKENAKKAVSTRLARAIEANKSRGAGRDVSAIVGELEALLAYNTQLEALGQSEDAAFPGLTSVKFADEAAADDTKRRDLRDLYKLFLDEKTKGGELSSATEAAAKQLQMVFGMGQKEAQDIYTNVQSEAYKNALRELFISGRLETAASKAEVLNELITRLNMNEELAMDINFGIYRTRFEQFLEAKKITEEQDNELNKLRIMLCIEQERANELRRDLCGKIYRMAIVDAFAAGINTFGFDEREKCKRVKNDLRLDDNMAKEILDAEARKAFMAMVNKARLQGNRLTAAKQMKDLVFFSNVVVSPLLEDAWGAEGAKAREAAAKQQKEFEEIMEKVRAEAKKEDEAKARAEGGAAESEAAGEEGTPSAEEAAAAEKVASQAKAEKAAAARAEGETVGAMVMKAQKEINLAKDLELRDRQDIYKNFLMYCMQGDVVTLGMGSTMAVERDEQEFARLQQLGDVLGLNQMEVSTVHQGLAEQAFRMQVQSVAGDGNMNKEREASLEEYRQKLGLSPDQAGKIIKGVTNQKLINSLQQLKSQGKLNLARILELKDQGIEVESFINEDMRMSLFRGEIESVISDGKGIFEAERFYTTLPQELKLDAGKAKRVVEEIVKGRKRLTLVQAISQLRQKKPDAAVASVRNYIAQHRAMPGLATQWDRPEELADLFMMYVTAEADEAKQAEVAQALALPEADVARLREVVRSGGFKLVEEAAKQASTFF